MNPYHLLHADDSSEDEQNGGRHLRTPQPDPPKPRPMKVKKVKKVTQKAPRVFSWDITLDGKRYRKLRYVEGHDTHAAAETFLRERELPVSHIEEVIAFIEKQKVSYRHSKALSMWPTVSDCDDTERPRLGKEAEEIMTHLCIAIFWE